MVADDGAIALMEERASSYLLFSALFYQEATKEFFEKAIGRSVLLRAISILLRAKTPKSYWPHLKASTRRCFWA